MPPPACRGTRGGPGAARTAGPRARARRAPERRSSAASRRSPSTRRFATCCPCGSWRTCAPARPSTGTSAAAPPPTRRPRRCSTRWCTTTGPTRTTCELARPECLFLLLGHGASPGLRDGGGLTPLELLLRHLGRDAGAASAAGTPGTAGTPAAPGEPRQRRLLLLDLLALYAPAAHAAAGPARRELLGDRPRWQRLLGEDKFQWLAGLAPPSLFVRAMQVLVTAISPGRFPEALDELPLPPFLQPLDLTGKG